MERINLTEIRKRISWGSVFAGVVTVLAISILISILTTSISLFMFDPLSDEPTSGIGTTVGIWTVVALIISLITGGFVAGKLAGADGMIHGFLVWATTMIVAVIMGVLLTIGAVKLTANILGSVSSVTGNVLSGMGSMVGNGVSALSDQAKNLFGNIDFSDDVNGNDIQKDIRRALKKSGVKELQPDYLENQLKAVKSDLKKTVKKIVADPNNADDLINGFMNRLQNRADKITDNIDRNDISRAIANNTDLSKAEADKAVDEYTQMINNGIAQVKEEINNLEQAVEKAKQEWEVMKQKALEEAEEASNAAARSALWSFFAMLIGAGLCSWAGSYGTRRTMEGYEA